MTKKSAREAQKLGAAARVIAAALLQGAIRDQARLIDGERIRAYLDTLVAQGAIKDARYESLKDACYESLTELADAVDDELRAAADEDRIAVFIDDPEGA